MIERSYTVSGPADLDLSVPSGSLYVDSGPPGRVDIQLDTNDEEFWHITQSGDAVTVGHERFGFMRGGRARLRVTAPEGSSLRASTASADVRVSVDLKRVTVNTASGDIHLDDAEEVNARTASGDLNVRTVDRDLSVKSASGHIRADAVGGTVSITTASGDVFIEAAHGRFSVSSASGDLRLGVFKGDDLEATSMSGDITVGLPAGRRIKLSANTLSGSVRLPERRPSSGLDGAVVSVRLKSVSGDLNVRRVD